LSDKTADVSADDTPTLYSQIVDVSGIEYDADKFETVEDYKQQLVRWYADEDEGDKRYEKSPEAVQDWVDAATKVAKANKSARRKQSLPAIDGLSQPEEKELASEAKTTGRRRSAKDTEEVKEKAEKAERDPTNNCYGHVFRLMAKNPKLTVDDAVAKLSRDGKEYSEVSVKRAVERGNIFMKVALETGLIPAP
jgi:hypothetical protein